MSMLDDPDELDRLMNNIPPEIGDAMRLMREAVPPQPTHTIQPKSGLPYDEVGRLKWTLKSQLEQLRGLRGHFINEDARHISLAITHLEDSLFRLGQVITIE